MRNFKSYQVQPNIPENLAFLETVSRNMWWCWTRDAVELFRRIDPRLWAECGRNPIPFLTRVPQARLEKLAKDTSYTWPSSSGCTAYYEKRINHPGNRGRSARWPRGVTSPIFPWSSACTKACRCFAGGLGILAGDHLKAASEHWACRWWASGLMYRQGYFRQFLNHDGWQQEAYPETDFYSLPIQRMRDAAGNEIRVSIRGADGPVHAIIWKVLVGRVPLYLLDTNILENPPEHREITARLYAAESKIRLAQEVLLGIGGMRALQAIGHQAQDRPHERGPLRVRGHRAPGPAHGGPRDRPQDGPADRAAHDGVHDPHAGRRRARRVPRRHGQALSQAPGRAAGHIGDGAALLGPGARAPHDNGPLSMFILGVRLAAACNGVSELHGSVARRMWAHVWPGRPVEEIPISHITNGVHIPTFVIARVRQPVRPLPRARLVPGLPAAGQHPAHRRDLQRRAVARARAEPLAPGAHLPRTARSRSTSAATRPRNVLEAVGKALDPDVLTIVFARRFATYKRAFLLIQDPQRLEALINNDDTAGAVHLRRQGPSPRTTRART
ncbi:MAG: DUF3417 domain-containing protein [Desulfobacterales bacterium]|nr:DUF3417 domain-containing protein [Desulfobacterales bacterium]